MDNSQVCKAGRHDTAQAPQAKSLQSSVEHAVLFTTSQMHITHAVRSHLRPH